MGECENDKSAMTEATIFTQHTLGGLYKSSQPVQPVTDILFPHITSYTVLQATPFAERVWSRCNHRVVTTAET